MAHVPLLSFRYGPWKEIFWAPMLHEICISMQSYNLTQRLRSLIAVWKSENLRIQVFVQLNQYVPVRGFQATAGSKNVFLHHKQSVIYPCHPFPTSHLQADFDFTLLAGYARCERRTYITSDILTDLPLRGSFHLQGSPWTDEHAGNWSFGGLI